MPAAKKPTATPKAMDIHTPATAPAVTTSKPVIVPTRSLAADPMLSENTSGSSTPTQAPATAPVINRQAKTIAPLSEPSLAEEPAAPVPAESEPAVAPDLTTVASESATPPKVAAEPAAVSEANPIAEASVPATNESDEDYDSEDEAETGTAVQEKTAEQMRADQLEELIAKGNYAVPLNRKHNRRMNAMLAIVFVLFIALITLDLLLDMEVLTLSGFPHTDLLAP